MEINDRGLGALIYRLMLGQVDERLFPGLNLLIRDETGPGGICHKYLQEQRGLAERFRATADEEQCRLFTTILMLKEDMYQEMSQVIFRYGMQLGPLLQKAPDGPEDELQDWNRFWSLDNDALDVERSAQIGREALKTVAEMAGIVDLFAVAAVPDEQERKRLYDEQLQAITELFQAISPDAWRGLEDVQRSKKIMDNVLQMLGLLSIILREEHAPQDAPDSSK